MGSILLHHPMVYVYLLFVTFLAIAQIWVYLHSPPADRDGSPAEPTPSASGTRPFQREPGDEGGRDHSRRPATERRARP
jgi:hypothetical protein